MGEKALCIFAKYRARLDTPTRLKDMKLLLKIRGKSLSRAPSRRSCPQVEHWHGYSIKTVFVYQE
jgi:hypothetical protein